MRIGARTAGLIVGVLADAVLGDPRRGHPVAGFGRVAAAAERRLYRDSVTAGAGYALLLTGGTVLAGTLVERTATRTAARAAGTPSSAMPAVLTAAATWVALGGTSLVREGTALAGALDAGDLAAARARIPHLCARDPHLLDAAGMARAGVESLAENTSDAVVGPLFWGAVAGIPGLLGYRAVNTLDAMVGYRSARYERFGRVPARLDDLANLLPARVTALVTVAVAPLVGGVGGSPRAAARAARAWRRDAAGHPSPNAGPVEATAAGALGVRLGGTTAYAHGTEQRPRLGHGRAPDVADLHRAARLSRLVTVVAAVLAAGAAEHLRHRAVPCAPGQRRVPMRPAGFRCGPAGSDTD